VAARPDCKAYRTALGSRCCGYRRPDPLGRRTTCQYDGYRHRNRSVCPPVSIRHVGCALGWQARSASGDFGVRRIADAVPNDAVPYDSCSVMQIRVTRTSGRAKNDTTE
jgi:hypothetical protein